MKPTLTKKKQMNKTNRTNNNPKRGKKFHYIEQKTPQKCKNTNTKTKTTITVFITFSGMNSENLISDFCLINYILCEV